MNPISNLIEKFRMLGHQFLEPGSQISLFGLASAFCIAFGFLYLRQRNRRGKVRAAAVLRALRSQRIFFCASTYADAGYFLINTLALGGLIGYAVISTGAVASGTSRGFASLIGTSHPIHLPMWLVRTLATIIFYLAYEFAYYLDHYLKHRITFLWETHRTHHTAEALTPLTVFRVHPLDSLIFSNIMALTAGPIAGLVNYVCGKPILAFTLSGTNILLVFFIYAYIHLQHSEVWIPFRGLAGRLFMSPAHHQIHHSTDPAHFNKNLGSCLALWDWIFGTLSIPSQESPGLRFGVEDASPKRHLPSGLLIEPVTRMMGAILRLPFLTSSQAPPASDLSIPSTSAQASRLAA